VTAAGNVPDMSIQEVSVDELEAALAAGARLVDVRETDEYVDGHVPGAVHVPLGTVPERVDAFQGQGATYVVCKSGARSMRACEFLADQGVIAVNVAGGTMAWKMSGRPVVEGDQPA
jgi:rhodanese-related sulfurtransferase